MVQSETQEEGGLADGSFSDAFNEIIATLYGGCEEESGECKREVRCECSLGLPNWTSNAPQAFRMVSPPARPAKSAKLLAESRATGRSGGGVWEE